MPLRDHFHPPLINSRSWEGFNGAWPAMIVRTLVDKLPHEYVAEPRVHLGAFYEIDATPQPTLVVATDVPDQYEYEVLVYDTTEVRRLVAAVEIVSPANKDRPAHRRLFVAKCAALLAQGVCVAIVDLVTTRHFNVYGDLLELIGQTDPFLTPEAPRLYAAVCRWRREGQKPLLETWAHAFAVGQPLPTLPLWLADDLAVPLELEPSYEETCRVLRIG